MSIAEQEIPTLAHGDNLTREEFIRIWDMHPEIKLAELIGGLVFMPPPTSIEHGESESDIGLWAGHYRVYTPGCASGHDVSCFLLDDLPQSDVNLRILPEYGGRSYEKDSLLAGIPEFFAEVCRSSVVYDLHQKKDLYEEAGIPEYLAILTTEREIRWHILEDGKYRLLAPGHDGVHRSRIFPGLWLDGAAFLKRDMVQVLAVLQKGLDSEEHRAFVQRLQEAKTKKN
ncbi:MAG: Uma2 family endonuclease [Gemmataceae bacterium]